MRARPFLPLALATALCVGACHKPPPAAKSLDAMDNELVNGSVTVEAGGNAAARNALAGDIRVDPARASGHAQPGDRAATTSLASIAERQAHHQPAMPAVAEGNDCTGGLAYSNDWAARLPADLPMHPQAKLEEAAGHDGGCSIRVASFAVPGDGAAVLAWYEAKAKAGGYTVARSARGGDQIIEGDRARDGTAYYITAGAPANGATPVDYIWTRGG